MSSNGVGLEQEIRVSIAQLSWLVRRSTGLSNGCGREACYRRWFDGGSVVISPVA